MYTCAYKVQRLLSFAPAPSWRLYRTKDVRTYIHVHVHTYMYVRMYTCTVYDMNVHTYVHVKSGTTMVHVTNVCASISKLINT